jgi:cyclophilin family peptidyl-prolyl cis-trans isomerase
VKTKLTAYRGRLVEVTEQLGEKPNGTAFAITLRAMPSLDQTNLVVGKVRCRADMLHYRVRLLQQLCVRGHECKAHDSLFSVQVVEGMDVVQALAALPSVKDNSGSGYVKCGLPILCSELSVHRETE